MTLREVVLFPRRTMLLFVGQELPLQDNRTSDELSWRPSVILLHGICVALRQQLGV